jgi:hypothetical protein
MRHEHRHLGLLLPDGVGDLHGGHYQTAGGVEDEVEGHVVIGHVNGAQDRLRIVEVDAARQRKAEEPHGFLPLDQEDHPRITLTFQGRDLAAAHGILPALPQHRLKGGEHDATWRSLPLRPHRAAFRACLDEPQRTPGCVKTLQGIGAPQILRLVVTRRAKKRRNWFSARR